MEYYIILHIICINKRAMRQYLCSSKAAPTTTANFVRQRSLVVTFNKDVLYICILETYYNIEITFLSSMYVRRGREGEKWGWVGGYRVRTERGATSRQQNR